VRKLGKLIDESGVLDIVSKGDIVAVKTHFGGQRDDENTQKRLY